jgi:hypothetical protein
MELDFDKEIDALLRRKDFSPPGTSVSPGEHLDADEIGAFAENALPEASRTSYMRHLASCDPCRKSLSTVIALGAENEPLPEKAATVPALERAEPWYRSIFRFPGLVYAMGGLTFIFAGFLAFSVLKNGSPDGSSDVSQIAETPKTAATRPPAEPEYSATANANTAVNTNSAIAANGPGNALANAAAATSALSVGNSTAVSKSAVPPKVSAARGETNNFQVDGAEKVPTASAPPPLSSAASVADSAANQRALEKDAKEREQADLALSARKLESLPLNGRGVIREDSQKARAKQAGNSQSRIISGPSRDMNTQIQNAMPANAENNAEFTGRRRSVAGRSFDLKQGVWYDSGFTGQSTLNFRRGTAEYIKLDSGLRSAADALGGTVVIMWKAKAYRIQ